MMDFKSAWRRALRLLAVPLFLVLASTQAGAVIGLIVGAGVLFMVSLLMRMAFVSKYALMALILLNPCVRDPCTGFTVAGITVPAPPADKVVLELNAGMLTLFHDFYVVAILYYAVYVIFMSTSPSARVRGKNMLMSLMVGMVIVSQSRVIMQLVLNLSQAIAYSIINMAGTRLASLGALGVMARSEMCILDLVFVSLGMVAMMAAGMRYFAILLMAAFFPLALFLYFIPFTKNYGIILIRATVLIIFIQVIQALLYAVTIISAVDETGLPGFIIAIGGLFGVVYSPMLGMKLMGWLGGVTHFYSTRAGGASTRFMAMLMRGQPLGTAFQTAGAQYMIAHNMGPLVRGLAESPMTAETAAPGSWGARPAAGYGMRSSRSYGAISEGRGGITEGHSGAGVSLPARRRGMPSQEPHGDYFYQKTPEGAGPLAGSAVRQKSQLERIGEFAAAGAAAGAMTPEGAGGGVSRTPAGRTAGTPQQGAAVSAAGGGGWGGEAGAAAKARPTGSRPASSTPALGGEAASSPAAGRQAAGGGAEEVQPSTPSAFGGGAAGGYGGGVENQERGVFEQGRFRVQEPRETMQKQGSMGATPMKGADTDKFDKQMARLRAQKGELLRKLQKPAAGETPAGSSVAKKPGEAAGPPALKPRPYAEAEEKPTTVGLNFGSSMPAAGGTAAQAVAGAEPGRKEEEKPAAGAPLFSTSKGPIDRWKGFKSTVEHPAPSHVTGTGVSDLEAVLAGEKPVAVVSESQLEKVWGRTALDIAKTKGFTVGEYTPGEGYVGGKQYVIGEKSKVDSVINLLEQGVDKRFGPEYMRELGRLLGYDEKAIDEFIKRPEGAPIPYKAPSLVRRAAPTVGWAAGFTLLDSFAKGNLDKDAWHEVFPTIPFTDFNVGRVLGIPDYQTKDLGKPLTFAHEAGKTSVELGLISAADMAVTKGGAIALNEIGLKKTSAFLAEKGLGRLAGPIAGGFAGWSSIDRDLINYTDGQIAMRGGGAILEGALMGAPLGPYGIVAGAGAATATSAGRAFYEVRNVRLEGERARRARGVDRTLEDAMNGWVKHDSLPDNELTKDARDRIKEMSNGHFNSLLRKNGLIYGERGRTLTQKESGRLQEILDGGAVSITKNQREIEQTLGWTGGRVSRLFEGGGDRLKASDLSKLSAINRESRQAEQQLETFYKRGVLTELEGKAELPAIRRDELAEFNAEFKSRREEFMRGRGIPAEESFIKSKIPLVDQLLENDPKGINRSYLSVRAPDIYSSHYIQNKVGEVDAVNKARSELNQVMQQVTQGLGAEDRRRWEQHMSGEKPLTQGEWKQLIDKAGQKFDMSPPEAHNPPGATIGAYMAETAGVGRPLSYAAAHRNEVISQELAVIRRVGFDEYAKMPGARRHIEREAEAAVRSIDANPRITAAHTPEEIAKMKENLRTHLPGVYLKTLNEYSSESQLSLLQKPPAFTIHTKDEIEAAGRQVGGVRTKESPSSRSTIELSTSTVLGMDAGLAAARGGGVDESDKVLRHELAHHWDQNLVEEGKANLIAIMKGNKMTNSLAYQHSTFNWGLFAYQMGYGPDKTPEQIMNDGTSIIEKMSFSDYRRGEKFSLDDVKIEPKERYISFLDEFFKSERNIPTQTVDYTRDKKRDTEYNTARTDALLRFFEDRGIDYRPAIRYMREPGVAPAWGEDIINEKTKNGRVSREFLEKTITPDMGYFQSTPQEQPGGITPPDLKPKPVTLPEQKPTTVWSTIGGSTAGSGAPEPGLSDMEAVLSGSKPVACVQDVKLETPQGHAMLDAAKEMGLDVRENVGWEDYRKFYVVGEKGDVDEVIRIMKDGMERGFTPESKRELGRLLGLDEKGVKEFISRESTASTSKTPEGAAMGVGMDKKEIEEKARPPKRTPGEAKEGMSEQKMPEGAVEKGLAEPRPSDVRALYEDLNGKLRGLKESGMDTSETDEMLHEASTLIHDMKYEEAYKKLENARRMLGI